MDSANLSLLANLALLSLSRNGIEGMREDALHGLTKLQTLLLGHNHISSPSLPDRTFSKLHSLQVLVLSNNALSTLRGSWFQHTRALTRLQLDGNQIPNLTDSSFGDTHLPSLRHLDLSNNFISYIGKNAFWPLPQLQEVDLSRNRLAHIPDVFTPLKQLIHLSLDKNQWHCTCDLQPLARFLRGFVNSSARTLRNAKDLTCQLPPGAVAPAKSVLRLSEANCDSKAPNFTLVLKDTSPIHPGRDVTLLTVLGFAGAVGLTCLGLVVFKWKLQKGKANEHTSENLCCRTFEDSLCAREARNYCTKGDCNCHLPQENQLKVMSIVESRKERPILQGNSHQATQAPESAALDGSFRNLKGKDHGADTTFFCLDGRLLQSGWTRPLGDMAALNDTDSLTRFCRDRVPKPGQVQPQAPSYRVTTRAISSDTFSRRYAASATALARGSLEKPLTNESWQHPIEKGDNSVHPHRQRRFILSSSPKPCKLEEHHVQKIVQKHRSKYDGPCGQLKWSRPRYSQPNNSLLCKYVPWDQFQDYVKEKKPHRRNYSKLEKRQIQINNAIEKFLMSEDPIERSGLSTKVKKTCAPKKVSFHDPDLVETNKSVLSPGAATYRDQQRNQSNQLTNLDLNKCSHPWVRNSREERFTDQQLLKKKRINRSNFKGEIKGQDVRMKLHAHAFRNARVHPEKPFPELSNKCQQTLLPTKNLSKASEKEVKINPLSSADYPQQPDRNTYVRLPLKSLSLKHAPKQTPSCKRNTTHASLLSSNNLSVGPQSSDEGGCRLIGQIPDGNPSPPIIAEHRHSHVHFSNEQVEGETPRALEAAGQVPAPWASTSSDVLPSCSFGRAMDKGPPDFPESVAQEKSKTIKGGKMNQFSLLLQNRTHLSSVQETDADTQEYTSDQNQALQQGECMHCHAHLGNNERTPATETSKSHHIIESHLRDEGRINEGQDLPHTETRDSSFIRHGQSESNLQAMETDSTPYQHRLEMPRELSPPSLSNPAPWHWTKSSDGGTDNRAALPREDSTDSAAEIKVVEEEENKMLYESKTNSVMVPQTAHVTSEHTTREKQKTWGNGKHEKPLSDNSNPVKATTPGKDLSFMSSPENGDRLPGSEIDLQMNNKVCDLSEVKNIQPDEESSVHEERERTVDKREARSPFPALRGVSFEAEDEGPLIPSRRGEAENSAPNPVL
ncbi:leucine-rich repeat-containing protein 53 [Echinops telfairi]|uniref:Leucine-rich repeat-containing protein 53 n=1 Tax=Echinops telfairi TaxID=9371 RepID=A0ABM1VKD9_ECHTE|nr:leucine-rich repeat-containing protein 53 [Echinops telfairi]